MNAGTNNLTTKRTKSPLKAKPLRNPGQSLDEQILFLKDEKVNEYLLIFVLPVVLMGLEWVRWYTELPYAPLAYLIFCTPISAFGLFKAITTVKRIRKLEQGRDGEKAVGQYLELLRSKGYRIFHDIVGDGYNIDHVIICEHGVYSVETKTYFKPEKGEAKILSYRDQLEISGWKDTSILVQAKAEANSLKSILEETSGRKIDVKPVVVFPGWYIEAKEHHTDVWVLNPKALPGFIEKAPKVLSKEDVMLLTYSISRYIRLF